MFVTNEFIQLESHLLWSVRMVTFKERVGGVCIQRTYLTGVSSALVCEAGNFEREGGGCLELTNLFSWSLICLGL